MHSAAILCVLLTSVVVCSGHLCLLSPKQRGTIAGLDKQASADCGLTQSPCGGRMQEKVPQAGWLASGNYTVIFQKNLNHYTSSNPGYFSVNLIGRDMTKELVRVPDGNEPSLYLYTVTGPLPTSLIKSTVYIVQVTYVTKNPNAPAEFYQCSDVIIL